MMNWSYKFAFDEIQEMLSNRPWLLVDNDFSSASNDDFPSLQKQIFQDRGWEWFKTTLRGRLFPKLNLTTLTTWNRERDPSQGDPDPSLVAKVEQKFPGVSIVSLIGGPHVVSGAPVSPEVLEHIGKLARTQRWKFDMEKIADDNETDFSTSYYKDEFQFEIADVDRYATDNNHLRQLLARGWEIPTGMAAGGALAWLLSLGIPPTQIEQQLQNGATPQQIITQVMPENFPASSAEPQDNADFAGNESNSVNLSEETLDNSSETTNIPRGLRNNNPGNIERNRTAWQGMAEDQSDERFITFASPEYGIRAMARVLKNYGRKHGLRTVEQIIGRWAPSSENQTGSYVQHVSQELGIAANSPLDLNDAELLGRLIQAIIQHENGMNPYDEETIARGVALEKAGGLSDLWSYKYAKCEAGQDID